MKLADYFTWSRLVLFFPITYFAYIGAQWWVFWLYIIAQATDGLDGWIARKTGTANEAGAKLDSRVDNVGVPFYLAWLWFLFPQLYTEYWPYIAILVGSIVLVLIASYWRLGEVTGLHLWSAKAAAIVGTVFLPALILFGLLEWLLILLFVVGMLSTIEELAFFILNKKSLDAKSIFFE